MPGFSPLKTVGNDWTIEAEAGQLMNRVMFYEDLSEGEAVQAFALFAEPLTNPARRVLLYQGTTIGHKAICTFPTVRTARITLEIMSSDGPAHVSAMSAYLA